MSQHHYTEKNASNFIDTLTQRIKTPRDWAFLHVKAKDGNAVDLGEIAQVLDFSFQGQEPMQLLHADSRQLIMLASNESNRALSTFEGMVTKNYSSDKINMVTHPLNEKGIEYLASTLDTMIGAEDTFSKLGLIRLRRRSNVFMVLDDDPMVLKQMEHMVKGFGHVETFSNPEDFILAYKRYAPNVIFVDVHLRGARGTNVPSLLQSRIDPFVHTIMISADSQAECILEAKNKGAKGYISKPISHEQLCRQVLTAPTFVQRQ